MDDLKNATGIRYYNAREIPFMLFGEALGGPLPLRRILSLLRLKDVSSLRLEISSKAESENCSGVKSERSEVARQCKSCFDFVKTVESRQQCLGLCLKEKKCYMIHFFNVDVVDVESKRYDSSNILGYCVIHVDKYKTGSGISKVRAYVPECVLAGPYEGIFSYGDFVARSIIDGDSYDITGNYYSQQNGITNCCAQAAIKMAIRAYLPNITCRLINQTYMTSNGGQRVLCGAEGMTQQEIGQAVSTISDDVLTTFTLNADESSGYEFVKSIYHAIESKIPVILIISLPEHRGDGAAQSHAIAIVGHTFHAHGWSAYGGMYFFKGSGGYLSSFHWCDNFVVQDDNFGPLYQIPPRLLLDIIGDNNRAKSFRYSAMARRRLANNEFDLPVSAIFIHPRSMPFIRDIKTVEQVSAYLLNAHVHELAGKRSLPKNQNFVTYFYKVFFIEGVEQSPHPESLVLRTLLVKKDKYLSTDIGAVYEENGVGEAVRCVLPDVFWVVEISISELFWVNQSKVGEIIIDPELYHQYNCEGKTADLSLCPLIRLPYTLTLFSERGEQGVDYRKFALQQAKVHHPLISERKSIVRDAVK